MPNQKFLLVGLLSVGLTILFPFLTDAAHNESVMIAKETNSVHTKILQLQEHHVLSIKVKNSEESQSWLHFRVSKLEKSIPELPYEIPHPKKEGDVPPGKEESFELEMDSGRYKLELFSELADCLGYGELICKKE